MKRYRASRMPLLQKRGVLGSKVSLKALEHITLAISIFLVYTFNYSDGIIGNTLTNGSMISFMAVEAMVMTSRRRTVLLPSTRWCLTFLLICTLSTLWSVAPDRTITRSQSLMIMFVWYLSLTSYLHNGLDGKGRLEFLLKVVVASSIFSCLYLAANSEWSAGVRATGIIGDSNQAGAYLCYALVIGMYCISERLLPRWLLILQVIATIAAEIISGSRTSIFTAGIVCVCYWFFQSSANKELISLKSLIVVCIILVTIYYLYMFIMQNQIAYAILGRRIQSLIEIMQGRQSNTNESSFFVRTQLRKMALSLWKESPILGKGIDTFAVYAAAVYRPVFCHNNYAEILEGVGIAGFIAFYGMYVAPIKLISGDEANKIAAILTLFVAIAVFHYTVVFYYQKLEYVYISILTALSYQRPEQA